jgi:hypothetical protein
MGVEGMSLPEKNAAPGGGALLPAWNALAVHPAILYNEIQFCGTAAP